MGDLRELQAFFGPLAAGWETRYARDGAQFACAIAECARVAQPGGRLAVFHAIGWVALTARHGGVPSDDDVIAPPRLRRLLGESGWDLLLLDDAPERFLAVAARR